MAGGCLNMRTWVAAFKKIENHCPRKIKHTRIAKLAGITLPPTAKSRKTRERSRLWIQHDDTGLQSHHWGWGGRGRPEAGGSLQV